MIGMHTIGPIWGSPRDDVRRSRLAVRSHSHVDKAALVGASRSADGMS